MGSTIRSRMALASVLPVLLVVLTIVGVFWQDRVNDLEESHQQRVGLLVNQLARFSAYGLFSGNTASLQSVVQAIQREPGVRSVQVFDADGKLVATSGTAGGRSLADSQVEAAVQRQGQRGIDLRIEEIVPTVLPIDDLFSVDAPPPDSSNMLLGNAVIEVSREALEARKHEALLTAAWIAVLGMSLGGLLAYRLGNWVVGPLVRVSQMVKRIGQGDLSLAEPVPENDPLQELQASLNQMAARLAWGRDELERQVAEVTQELRLKKEQAESATRAKSRFLAAASHDLRQPSHALGMFVARLGQLPMDIQARQVVNHLEISVQAMQDLLDGLLDLSRLDAGNVPIRMGPVPLNPLLDSVRQALEGMAQAKGLRLRLRPTTLWVRSDAMLLQRMLVNLVINAIRYTEQGTVLVACRRQSDGQRVRIEVWDSGIGIPAEQHENIFQEFFQISSRAGDRNFGLGLGLNIVQRSAQLLGHQVVLRSELGRGTRFSILLDSAHPTAADTSVDALLPSPGDVSGMHILVIEDNANAREAVQGLLQSWGCLVRVAASRGEAEQHLQSGFTPGLILSDYHLGAAENGIECIRALRAQAGAQIPACLMSGETHEEFLQLVKAEDLPLLHKPVRPAKLRSLLRHLKA